MLVTIPACTNPELTAAVEEAGALSAQYKTSLRSPEGQPDEQKTVAAREAATAKEEQDVAAIAASERTAELQKASVSVEAPLARVTQADAVPPPQPSLTGRLDTAGWETTVGGLIGGPYGAAAIGTGIGIPDCWALRLARRRTQAAGRRMVNGIDAAAASACLIPARKRSHRPPPRAGSRHPLAQKIVDKNSFATLPKASHVSHKRDIDPDQADLKVVYLTAKQARGLG